MDQSVAGDRGKGMVAIGREANTRILTSTNSFEIMMATATGNLKEQKTKVVRSEVHPDSLLIGMNSTEKRCFLISIGNICAPHAASNHGWNVPSLHPTQVPLGTANDW